MRPGALGLLAVVAISGCGYTTRSMLPEDVDSIAIDVFGNETFYREIGIELTKELTDEINHRTVWRVARRSDADAVIRGRVLRVRRPTLVEDDNDTVDEQAVIVTAEVVLESMESGRELDRFIVSNRAEFIVPRGETLESAFAEVLRDLSERIVNMLQRKSFERDLRELRGDSDEAVR